MGHVCNPRCALRSHVSTNILYMFACNIILILGGYAPLLCRDWAITAKKVLLGRSFPAEPTQTLEFCMSNQKRTEFCRGEYLKPIVLQELVRGRPWVLEIYSHHKKRRGFFGLFLPVGKLKVWGRAYGWWKILHCWKIYASEVGTYICSYCCSPHLISSTPFLPKHRKILLKFVFCPSFHCAVMFFLSLVGPCVWRVKPGH